MMKTLKKIVCVVIALICTMSIFTACGGKNNENGDYAKFESSDGKYELALNSKGKAYIAEKGKDEKIITGSCSVREENSALTLVLDDEIIDVTNERYTISFTVKNETAGIDAFFRLHRGKMLKGLNMNGVILDTGSSDPNEASEDEGSGGDTMGGFSMATSFLVWNSGKIEIKIIKVQANFNYTFDATNGLKFNPTDYQTSTFGTIEVEDFVDGEYVVHFNINAMLPFGLSGDQKANIKKADLEAAFDF